MTLMRIRIARIVAFFCRSTQQAELDEEIRTHLELATREYLRRGMSPKDAGRAARRAFGSVDQAKERCDDLRGRWAHDAMGDLRIALRLLRKEKSFTAAVLLTLAICLGANVAVFSVVNAVLVEPLALPDPDRLVSVTNAYPIGAAGDGRVGASVRHYLDRLEAVDVLSEQALYQPVAYSLDEQGVPAQYGGLRVTPSFFRVAGMAPKLGRTFTESESDPGNHQKVVVSHAFWLSQRGGAPNVVGSELRLDGRPYEIVGVMPADFRFVRDDSWFWVPAVFTALERSDERRHANNWYMLGRLTSDGTVQQAQAQVNALNLGDLERLPESRQLLASTGFHTIVAPLHADMVREVRDALYLLWGGVLFVLLIGCVNVANLTAIRAMRRRKEFGLRQAFGASRGRLARQLVGESVLLAGLGALLGVPLGAAALRLAVGLGASSLPRGSEIGVDSLVVACAVGTSLTVGCLLGVVSFWRVGPSPMRLFMGREGRGATGDRRTRLVSNGLVTVQISAAFILLIGALLMLVSLDRLLAVDPGFEPEQLLTATVNLPTVRYPTPNDRRAFARRAADQLRDVPGVEKVGIASTVPFAFCCPTSGFHAEGATAADRSYVAPYLVMANADYFAALGVRLVEGRLFDDRDTATSSPVVVIDEDLARAHWPGRSAIGRRVSFTPDIDDDTQLVEVIGVVARHVMRSLAELRSQPGVHYLPQTQHPIWFMTFAIRTSDDPHTLVRAIRTEMAAVDPALPLFDVQTMEERLDAALAPRRLPTALASGFALVAVFLAALGLYGVLAYRVSQRTKEMAIRMALGSTAIRLYRLVIAEGAWVLSVGLVAGAGGAFLIRDLLASQLYDIQVMDARVLLVVGLLMSLVTVAACALPARRAVSIDPVSALNDS